MNDYTQEPMNTIWVVMGAENSKIMGAFVDIQIAKYWIAGFTEVHGKELFLVPVHLNIEGIPNNITWRKIVPEIDYIRIGKEKTE